jgi:hypothetical protein
MNNIKTYTLILFLITAISSLVADDINILELKVTREDEDTGKSIFTIRTLPGKTVVYDKIDYKITYHQEFDFEDSRGNKYHKIHEPAVFKYSAKNVKMVEDLDNYINFRVPVSRERLKVIYGTLTFHPKYPISIPQIEITAFFKKKLVWKYTVKVNEIYLWSNEKNKLIVDSKSKKK